LANVQVTRSREFEVVGRYSCCWPTRWLREVPTMRPQWYARYPWQDERTEEKLTHAGDTKANRNGWNGNGLSHSSGNSHQTRNKTVWSLCPTTSKWAIKLDKNKQKRVFKVCRINSTVKVECSVILTMNNIIK